MVSAGGAQYDKHAHRSCSEACWACWCVYPDGPECTCDGGIIGVCLADGTYTSGPFRFAGLDSPCWEIIDRTMDCKDTALPGGVGRGRASTWGGLMDAIAI